MPRPLRVEYPGALYHVLSRGDRREAIFADDLDRHAFVASLAAACAKTGWQVHAYVLMGNHFHLVVETPQANLALGMKWLLGTYTQRFNRRHRHGGHLFGGRYKAQPVDERDPAYLVTACDYVHLNPARARLVGEGQPLTAYPWSSLPAYLNAPSCRPPWLRCDRLLGENGLKADGAEAGRGLVSRTETLRRAPGRGEPTGVGPTGKGAAPGNSRWWLGAEDFARCLAERLGRRGHPGERAAERGETDRHLAERLVGEGLARLGWRESDLALHPKGDVGKVAIACELRARTPMTRTWIANRLAMGSASYLSALLAVPCSVNSKL